MKSIEQRLNPQDVMVAQPEMEKSQSWESYLQHLGRRFQVDFTQAGTSLKLGLADRRLIIAVGRTDVSVSYGDASADGMTPHAEVSFGITANGQLMPSEIVYTDEVWDDFQAKLRQSNQPPSDEQGFDGERFALYLLDKVSQEAWLGADRLTGGSD